ncbi:hypothetical protein BJ508DRAFT_307319 [Ascobolus immersus RN42]|uniref:Uncharacterized protein n=1 Tax=Ascobolus immersus RN42 TaxID=1160509 RepID=A0A3N4I8I7_ASCIM|nr:hypothetical protein BJ508DRAFT_307319 [Ascobolus immersus RN42]
MPDTRDTTSNTTPEAFASSESKLKEGRVCDSTMNLAWSTKRTTIFQQGEYPTRPNRHRRRTTSTRRSFEVDQGFGELCRIYEISGRGGGCDAEETLRSPVAFQYELGGMQTYNLHTEKLTRVSEYFVGFMRVPAEEVAVTLKKLTITRLPSTQPKRLYELVKSVQVGLDVARDNHRKELEEERRTAAKKAKHEALVAKPATASAKDSSVKNAKGRTCFHRLPVFPLCVTSAYNCHALQGVV